MPGYVIHIAIAKEYIKKHKDIENIEEFINGNIAPDLTEDKTKTHYGKSPTYTNLKAFLENNKLNNSFNKGMFLHLITDYLFYNHYLKDFPRKESRTILYDDYDKTNKGLIERYNIDVLKEIKQYIFYKEGIPHILTLDFIMKIIEEVSNLNIEEVKKEVLGEEIKWNTYKLI